MRVLRRPIAEAADSAAPALNESGDREFRRRLPFVVVVGSATIYTLWLGRLDVALLPGAPTHSDLGGHIVALRHLFDVSLPSGHLLDWSHQWFAGYPSFYFYFPLPAIIVAALTLVWPLEVAAKLFAVLTPALLPGATWHLFRSWGHSRAHAAGAVIGSVAFLSMTSQYIFGGNVLSSVIGEYSYALALFFAILYVARLGHAMRGSNETAALSLLLAATALSHLIPLIFAVVASCTALGNTRTRGAVITSWALGFAVSAFWSVPFLIRSPFMGQILWVHDVNIADFVPASVTMVLLWTAVGGAAIWRDRAQLRVLLAFAIAGATVYLLPHGLFTPGRALPLWHYSIYVLTGAITGALLNAAVARSRRYAMVFWAAGLAMLAGTSIMQADLVRVRSAELLDSTSPDLEAYEGLASALEELPPGLVHWERRVREPAQLGAPLPLARLPAEARDMRTTLGLLVESALTSPVFVHLEMAVTWDTGMVAPFKQPAGRLDHNDRSTFARMRQLGVRYLVTFSDTAAERVGHEADDFLLLGHTPEWRLWQVSGTSMVEPVRVSTVPAVEDWKSEVSQWIDAADTLTTWRVITADRLPGQDAPPQQSSLSGSVELGHRTIRFRTDRIGVPHLLRVAYFPNWRTTDADGPYMAVPGFMVVVPRQAEVVLRFERTWAEALGALLTLLGVATVVLQLIRGRAKSAAK